MLWRVDRGEQGKQQKDCYFNGEGRKWPVHRKELRWKEVPSWWLSFSVSTFAGFYSVRVFAAHFFEHAVRGRDRARRACWYVGAPKNGETSGHLQKILTLYTGFKVMSKPIKITVWLLNMFDCILLPVRLRRQLVVFSFPNWRVWQNFEPVTERHHLRRSRALR